MNYSTFIKEKLVSLINEMDQYHWLFTRNAEKDFSRIKKWSFGEIMRFIYRYNCSLPCVNRTLTMQKEKGCEEQD